MKKLFTIVTVCFLGSLLAGPLHAHEDQSFTNRATAGMFDDMYDLFKYSPAYQARFEKNALWTQLANLQNWGDRIFNNSSSGYYFIAAQNEIMGLGRLGIAFDWFSEVESVENEYLGESPSSHYGFGEGTTIEYADLDSDDYMDFRRETYGRSEASDRFSTGDLYLAYGMSNVMNMDIGLGVRGRWGVLSPTYTSNSPMGPSLISFDSEATEREYDITDPNNEVLILKRDVVSTGHWDLGEQNWRLILSGAMQNLMNTGLDVVINVAPMVRSVFNDYELIGSQTEDTNPSNPNLWSDESITFSDTGCEMGNFPGGMGSSPPYLRDYEKPSLSIGVDADVRMDYTWSGVNFTGWLGAESWAGTYQNAKRVVDYQGTMRETDTSSGDVVLESTQMQEKYTFDWDGDLGATLLLAKIRAQIPFEGWRIGFGINMDSTNVLVQEKMESDIFARERFDAGTSNPSDSYTTTINIQEESEYTQKQSIMNVEFPVGIVVDVFSNVNIQMGVKHTIQRNYYSAVSRIIATEPAESTKRYDDGAIDVDLESNTWQSLFDDVNMDNEEYIEVSQATNMYYGLTWWAFEQVRVDVQGMTNLNSISLFNVSVNLYY